MSVEGLLELLPASHLTNLNACNQVSLSLFFFFYFVFSFLHSSVHTGGFLKHL